MSDVSYSELHPHEPELLPQRDAEGRCLVCGLLVRLEDAERTLTELRDAAKRKLIQHQTGSMSAYDLRCECGECHYARSVLDVLAVSGGSQEPRDYHDGQIVRHPLRRESRGSQEPTP